ncbi:hypothetical protein GF325_02715 [Candidatus Bathyarchaeota archaeon]|nr:hypothetical protein [Candidatus Bathyarchaeota archaeon]
MKRLLYRSLATYLVILLLGLTAFTMFIHGVISLVRFLLGATLIAFPVRFGIDFSIALGALLALYRVASKRFINVTPSFKLAHEFSEGPWLHHDGDPRTSITINWFSPNPSPEHVEIINTRSGISKLVTDKSIRKMHHVQIDNLEPGTIYTYKITNKDTMSDQELKFRTAASNFESFAFGVVGDSQNCGGAGVSDWGYRPIIQSLQAESISLLFHVGDATDQGNDLRSWHEFLETSRAVISSIPLHVAAGNHDTGTRYMKDPSARKAYPDEGANFDYVFGYPYADQDREKDITPFKNRYYLVEYPGVIFLMLDTQNSKMAHPSNSQWDWMKKVLARIPDAWWKFVFVHRDLVRIRMNDAGDRYYVLDKFAKFILPILTKFKVDAIFQGHAHHYASFSWQPAGNEQNNDKTNAEAGKSLEFITCGGAGKHLREHTGIDASTVDLPGFHYQSNSSHFIVVQVNQSRCIVQAKLPDGTIFHERHILHRDSRPFD